MTELLSLSDDVISFMASLAIPGSYIAEQDIKGTSRKSIFRRLIPQVLIMDLIPFHIADHKFLPKESADRQRNQISRLQTRSAAIPLKFGGPLTESRRFPGKRL
jgi:hypothetical protein